MKDQTKAEKLAEDALKSIDDIQPLDVNEFLFTRIKNRIIKKREDAAQQKAAVMYRLSVLLVCLLIINITSYYFLLHAKHTNGEQKTSAVEAIASDYNLEQDAYNY